MGYAKGAIVLTALRLRILGLLAEGRSDKEIAADLGITRNALTHHLMRIYAALGVRDRGNARVRAARWYWQSEHAA